MKNDFFHKMNNVKLPGQNQNPAQTQTQSQTPNQQHDNRQQANQQNAQHSTGPKTEAGKAISKLNATVHNLRGQFRLLPHEDVKAYVFQLQAAMHEYAPMGMLESKLVIQLVHCQWQIDRTADHLYTAQAESMTSEEELKRIDKFSLYRQRFLRERKNLLKELKELKLERDAGPRTPLSMAEWAELDNAINHLDEETLASFVHFSNPSRGLLPSQAQVGMVAQIVEAKNRILATPPGTRNPKTYANDTEKAVEHLADVELALEE